MRGSKANFRCRLEFSCIHRQRLNEEGKAGPNTGYSSPAYLGRGWMRGSKTNFICRLVRLLFSCLLRQRLDEGE
jgi:hypothetical protein